MTIKWVICSVHITELNENKGKMVLGTVTTSSNYDCYNTVLDITDLKDISYIPKLCAIKIPLKISAKMPNIYHWCRSWLHIGWNYDSITK